MSDPGSTETASADGPATTTGMLTAPEPSADVPAALGNLAQIAYEAENFTRAIEPLDRSLAIRTAQLGPDHPDSMSVLNNRSLVQMDRGELAAAEADVRRAIEIGERNLGPDHPELDPPRPSSAPTASSRARESTPITRAASSWPGSSRR